MPTVTLRTIRPESIRNLVPQITFGRGLETFQRGAVSELTCGYGLLRAQVRGAHTRPFQVSALERARGAMDLACTCAVGAEGSPCQHVVAALLAWISKRDGTPAETLVPAAPPPRPNGRPAAPPIRSWGPPRPAQRAFLDDDPADTLDDEDTDGYLHAASPFLPPGGAAHVPGWSALGPPETIEVDLLGDGPALELRMTFPDGWRGTVVVPPHRAPALVEELRQAPGTVVWASRAAAVRVHAAPLVPELRAEYAADGALMLTPSYWLKGARESARVSSAEAVAKGMVGEGWFWDGKGFYRLETAPERLRPYFTGGRPLRLEGDAIPEFLRRDYPLLEDQPGFWPSRQVREGKVLALPRLAAVAVQEAEDDWLWLDPVYGVGDHRIPLGEIAGLRGKGRFVRLGNDWLSLEETAPLAFWRQAGGTLESGRVRLPRLGYLRARAEWGEGVAVEAPEALRRFEADLDRLRPPQPAPHPTGYTGTLRAYQRAGYDWLWFLRESGLHGVLADEMGLGKTHQALALLCAAYGNEALGPSLIVCPTSVLDHWEDKLRVFAPGLAFVRHHGTGRARLDSAALPPIVLTTYSLLGRDLDQLQAVAWEHVILDEAQKIKNPGTQMAQACRLLRASHRLALTGTPIENRPAELWAIFDFLLPGYLGPAERFRERYEAPILRQGDPQAVDTLRRVLHPFKLRRLKREVLAELPPKQEDVRFCHLTPHQAALYREVIAMQGRRLVDDLRRPGVRVDYLHIFAVLSRLKRICDHPSLVLEAGAGTRLASGKFDLFKELMEEALEGDAKVVVFSQYLEMLDLIEAWLRERGTGFSGLRGSTQRRGAAVRRFQEEPACRVFVGSLLAGGLGIDLTAASIVIHYDRWWNAAREDQATDRVHRIGQARGVQVLKLVTRGTLEEKIDAMIRRKAALMDALVAKDDALFKALSREELIDLLTGTP